MTKAFQAAALIGIDWGTSHLRAFLLDASGNVLASREAESGVGKLDTLGFKARFLEATAGWPNVPAVLVGMIGSRQGWVETGYNPCPADLSLLSIKTRDAVLDGRRITIIPGLSCRTESGKAEVMRGEETQIAGLLASESNYSGIIVLPGTHSKWVRLLDGRIEDFGTYLTGELFSVLTKQTILSHSVTSQNSPDMAKMQGYIDGATSVLKEGRPLLGELFGVRTRSLIDGIDEAENRAFLSALVISSEIAAARDAGWNLKQGRITLIGATALLELYRKSFEIAGISITAMDGSKAVLAGIMGIAREAGLISPKDAA